MFTFQLIVGLCQLTFINSCIPLDEETVQAKYLDNVSSKYGNDLAFLYVIEPLLTIARMRGVVAKKSVCHQTAECNNPVKIGNVDVGQNSCPRNPITSPGALQQQTSICPWWVVLIINDQLNKYNSL